MQKIDPRTESNAPKVKVLMIEDERFTREVLTRFLHKGGITEIVEAPSAEQAWRELTEGGARGVNVILLDLTLPGMSGGAFVKKLRSLPSAWAKSVPIVVLSADTSTASYVNLRPFNIAAYLIKPVSAELLKSTLERAVGDKLLADRGRTNNLPVKESSPPSHAPNQHASSGVFMSLFQIFTGDIPRASAIPHPVPRNVLA